MIQNPIPWPNDAKVAVAITFDMDADSLIHIEKGRSGVNYLSSLSMLRYGPEVAIPRILDGYKRFGLTQTFFTPAWCIEQHPRAIEAVTKSDFTDTSMKPPTLCLPKKSFIGCNARSK